MEHKQSIAFFTGSAPFIEELKKRNFKNGDDVVKLMDPQVLTTKYLFDNGFTYPIVLNSTEGLEMVVPPFDNWSDLEEYVGADTEVEVIDVEKQDHVKYDFSTFVRYMKKPKRHRTLNLISLECSSNGLNNLIEPPNVAKELDWTVKFWPPDEEESRPKVQKYCLISPKNSYTDFHIDFGGTSVWYHIVKGEKIFYIIRPSEANTSLYWNWSDSRNRLHTFFGDQVDECYKCTLQAGQTLFLPTGWIHAVLTTEDSLVYGGNFLHSLSIEEQLAIHSLETKYQTPMKYKFPHFEDLHWLAGQGLLAELGVLNRKQVPAPKYLVSGLKSLGHYLRQWMPNERMFLEEPSEANNLLKELNKQVRISERLIQLLNPPKPERGSTRTRKRPVHEDFVDYSITRKVKTPKKQPESTVVSTEGAVEPVVTSLSNIAEAVMDTVMYPPSDTGVNWQILNGGLKLMLKRGSTVDNLSSPSTSSGIRHEFSDGRLLDFSSNLARLIESSSNDEDNDDNPLQIVEFTEFDQIHPSMHGGLLSSAAFTSQSPDLKLMQKSNLFQLTEAAFLSEDSPSGEIGSFITLNPTFSTLNYNLESDRPVSPPKPSSLLGDNPSPKRKRNNVYHEDPHIDSHVVHQDDDYIYPSLELTDEENEDSFSGQEKGDEPWCPKAKVGKVLPRTDRPSRVGKQKIAVEKGLEAAASTPSSSPKVTQQKKKKVIKPPIPASTPNPLPKPTPTPPAPPVNTPPKNTPKPKKGFATPKQRLGKILKLHRIHH